MEWDSRNPPDEFFIDDFRLNWVRWLPAAMVLLGVIAVVACVAVLISFIRDPLGDDAWDFLFGIGLQITLVLLALLFYQLFRFGIRRSRSVYYVVFERSFRVRIDDFDPGPPWRLGRTARRQPIRFTDTDVESWSVDYVPERTNGVRKRRKAVRLTYFLHDKSRFSHDLPLAAADAPVPVDSLCEYRVLLQRLVSILGRCRVVDVECLQGALGQLAQEIERA